MITPVRTLAATPGEGITREQLIEKLGSEKAAGAYWEDQHNYYAFEMKLKKWRDIPKPTIAMVHGWCVYGAVFSAAAMDIIFASEDAMFVFPFGQYDNLHLSTEGVLMADTAQHGFLSGGIGVKGQDHIFARSFQQADLALGN